MATTEIKIITLAKLGKYNEAIKKYIADADRVVDARSIKSMTIEGRTLKFFKVETPGKTDAPAYSVEVPDTDLSAVNNAIKEVKAITDKLDGEDTVEGSVKAQIKALKTEIEGQITASEYDDTEIKKSITACAGNDSRLSNARPANGGTSTYANYVWATSHQGSWYQNSQWDGTYFQTNYKNGDSVLPMRVNNAGYADSAGSVAWSNVSGRPSSRKGHPTRLCKTAIESMVRKLGIISGVTRVHPHLFRATFATRLAERDTDIGVIAKLLGHADLESVNRYVLIDQTKIEATIRQKGFCS